jgi:2-dehydro-3-deoxyphosphogluconate aldolase/(4S)-4-hydroxy-2-oxoglutarate aldolase
LIETLSSYRLVPVVEIHDAADATPLAEALIAGGLPVLEITLRTEAAGSALRQVVTSGAAITLAAGTVISEEQVKLAVDNGARFIVSPGLNRPVIEYCLKQGIPVLPGVCTPSEIETARGYGLKALKFFPAEAYGGVRTLKALASVYRDFSFVPTGGVTLQNLPEYLGVPTVIACGGTWIAPADAIKQRKLEAITERAREAVELASSLP